MNILDDYVIPVFLYGALGLTLIVLFVGLPWLAWEIYSDGKSPTFALRKDEWVATKSHDERTTTYVMVGNVMVPIINTSTVVDQWTRRHS